ncbi:IclR family transcriptional regulator [Streptomyces albidus (ex Kaewkla and Franco 2022)]|uniref:IclR family transcriptional regulator n=1 Tax=Streptomyces albidus (ex Kaewkla and Franco 2022) TaxID=722709 RepID=UPI0015EF8298|nr:IclR family transcriptional regulator [Streptomyces albidus (ex Kaewkla and Franco 2022)]
MEPEADSSAATPVRSVARAIDILMALGNGPRRLGDVSSETALSKTTAYRILSTLRQKGMVLQDETSGEYRLGPACFHVMSSVVSGRAGFPFDADLNLEQLREQTQETVTVHVRAGYSRICIQELPSPQAIRYTAGLGVSAGIHVGSAGKVLIAFMPPSEREALLRALEPRAMTPDTITDMDVLREQLDEVARRGTAFSSGERVSGAVGVSAPVFDGAGFVVAALSVLGPASRLGDARLKEFEKLVRETAEQITGRTRPN